MLVAGEAVALLRLERQVVVAGQEPLLAVVQRAPSIVAVVVAGEPVLLAAQAVPASSSSEFAPRNPNDNEEG